VVNWEVGKLNLRGSQLVNQHEVAACNEWSALKLASISG